MRSILLLLAVLSALLPAATTRAAESGLALPRFVALRADEVTLRAGPGLRYPKVWVYQRKNLPMEVIAEFDTWRKVRDWEGSEGWVHQSLLTGARYAVITGTTRALRRDPDDNAAVVVRAQPGVILEILECRANAPWCRLGRDTMRGWLRRDGFWGAYPDETVK